MSKRRNVSGKKSEVGRIFMIDRRRSLRTEQQVLENDRSASCRIWHVSSVGSVSKATHEIRIKYANCVEFHDVALYSEIHAECRHCCQHEFPIFLIIMDFDFSFNRESQFPAAGRWLWCGHLRAQRSEVTFFSATGGGALMSTCCLVVSALSNWRRQFRRR